MQIAPENATVAVTAGFDAVIFLVIVVATIVAQVVKAARRVGTTPPPETRSMGGGPDELRRFLESLGGAQEQPRPPSSQPPARPIAEQRPMAQRQVPLAGSKLPPPPPLPGFTPARRVARPTAPIPRATPVSFTPPAVARKPAVPAPKPSVDVYKVKQGAYLSREGVKETPELRRESILRKLLHKRSVREAIVLREVLGPPVGLRRAGER